MRATPERFCSKSKMYTPAEGLPDDFCFLGLNQLRGLPPAIVERRRVPVYLRLSRVVRLSIVYFSEENRRDVRLPRFVRQDPIHRPVLVLDSQLRPQGRRRFPVVVALPEPLQGRRVPAGCKQRPHGIFARFYFRRHVVRLVNDALPEVRPSRRQNFVAHSPAVDRKLVGTKRRRINSRGGHWLRNLERPP